MIHLIARALGVHRGAGVHPSPIPTGETRMALFDTSRAFPFIPVPAQGGR